MTVFFALRSRAQKQGQDVRFWRKADIAKRVAAVPPAQGLGHHVGDVGLLGGGLDPVGVHPADAAQKSEVVLRDVFDPARAAGRVQACHCVACGKYSGH